MDLDKLTAVLHDIAALAGLAVNGVDITHIHDAIDGLKGAPAPPEATATAPEHHDDSSGPAPFGTETAPGAAGG